MYLQCCCKVDPKRTLAIDPVKDVVLTLSVSSKDYSALHVLLALADRKLENVGPGG